jgi:hypothetical protein
MPPRMSAILGLRAVDDVRRRRVPCSQFWFDKRSTGCLLMIAVVVAACTSRPFPTATLYDTPHAFVRLEADPATGRGPVHSHPVTVSPDQIAAVLNGVTIDEPITRMPIYDDLSIPRHHRAFDENMIAFLSPLLSLGLAQATSEEVITFYVSKDRSGGSREVTSGGLFVQGEELHFVLANYRSPTNYMSDFGAAETTDDRLTPMRSMTPRRGHLGFEPSSALRVPTSGVFSRIFQAQEPELIIAFKQLTPYSLNGLDLPSLIPPRANGAP